MRNATSAKLMKRAKARRRGSEISHILFVVDSILFGEANERSVLLLKQTLDKYVRYSGQCVNFQNSTIFFSTNTHLADMERVSNMLVMRMSTNLKKYLGLPNMVEKGKKASFQYIKYKINLRIEGWSMRFLSQEGKEVLIKSILQALPTYAMTCFLLPKKFFGDLDRLTANFWW